VHSQFGFELGGPIAADLCILLLVDFPRSSAAAVPHAAPDWTKKRPDDLPGSAGRNFFAK